MQGSSNVRLGLGALIAALIGAGLVVALLFATGAVHTGGSAPTVIEQQPALAPTAAQTTSGVSPASLYARAASGAVDITATGTASNGSQGFGPFGPFGPSQQPQSTATGSGFVIDGQGHILTAAHVVDGASTITISLQNGTTRKATLVGEDKSTDVAVLKVDPSGLSLDPLPLGSSKSLTVGDAIAAIGDPYGYRRSLSTGVVSGLDRTIQAPDGFTIPHAIQTDAALNPGNSGGPVLDANGQVIGIADQIATDQSSVGGGQPGSTGVGFAVPIDVARTVVTQLEHNGKVSHAYLGIGTAPPTGSQAGALVQAVQSGSPAAKAGLRTGDLVVAIDGSSISGVNDLIDAISSHQPGDRIKLTVQRGSQRLTITATLAQQPTQAPTG